MDEVEERVSEALASLTLATKADPDDEELRELAWHVGVWLNRRLIRAGRHFAEIAAA